MPLNSYLLTRFPGSRDGPPYPPLHKQGKAREAEGVKLLTEFSRPFALPGSI